MTYWMVKRYNRIKAALADAGIEQQDLAEILGVTPNTISRWCTNKFQPSVPQVFEIAVALGIEVCKVLETVERSKEEKPSPAE
jgi:transcriptional regulator with XRE-family HTH domain